VAEVRQRSNASCTSATSALRCVAVCCSVLQYVAVCYSVLQCVALCCIAMQCVAVWCSVLQHTRSSTEEYWFHFGN